MSFMRSPGTPSQKISDLLSENEELKLKLINAEATIDALRLENAALAKRLRAFTNPISVPQGDSTFITNNNLATYCDNCGQEVPKQNLDVHLSFCIRHITHCSFCNQTIKKQDLENHILTAKGSIQDLAEEVKRSDFEKITDREAHGADIKEQLNDGSGNTLLHVSVRTGNKEIVHYLLVRGLDINHRNRYGETPLHFVCGRNRDLDMVKLLVSKGADYNITNNLGESALCKIYTAQAQRNGDHEAALFFTTRNKPQLSLSISDSGPRPETSSESKRLKTAERSVKRANSRASRVENL